jgi:uncharacterized protein YlbG (UPF0298 family)
MGSIQILGVESMEEKYPELYFEHYIASFSGIRQEANEKGFLRLAELYVDIEGIDAFTELIKEINIIKENNDWSYFENIAKQFAKEELDESKLKEMAELTIKYFNNL